MTRNPRTAEPVNAVYLHGFASSPESSKAIRIAEALRPIATTRVPDLNQPSFRALTVTRMIGAVRRELDEAGDGPAVLIGSSLGAFVAVHTAAADPRVKGLVLLAPALDFGADENDRIGMVSIADWRAAGSCEVFHFAWGRRETLDFTLYEDAQRHDAFALALQIPVLIFQGTRDAVVDPAVVRRWAQGRAGVKLVEVDDDHQLQSSVDRICRETAAFVASLAG